MHHDSAQLLRHAVSGLVFEMTRWKREGTPREIANPGLLELAGRNRYVHFSDLNKLGIKPTSDFGTPLGIYGYILDGDLIRDMDAGTAAQFARDRAYAHVFKARRPDRIMNLSHYSEMDYAFDIKDLKKTLGGGAEFDDIVSEAEDDARVQTPAGLIWNVTRLLSQKNPRRWAQLLSHSFHNKGVDGIVDPGRGIIHPNEPAQAVFFSTSMIEQVATIDNNSVSTFNPSAEPAALEKLETVVMVLNRKLRSSEDSSEREQTLRAKLIDPFIKNPSSAVRYRALTWASDTGKRAALDDNDAGVRREALSFFKHDVDVLLFMLDDDSPDVVDDAIDHLANNINDDNVEYIISKLESTMDAWIRVSRIAQKISNMIAELKPQ